jgi:hypothetical protein
MKLLNLLFFIIAIFVASFQSSAAPVKKLKPPGELNQFIHQTAGFPEMFRIAPVPLHSPFVMLDAPQGAPNRTIPHYSPRIHFRIGFYEQCQMMHRKA